MVLDIIASIIVWCIVISAFDPKNRYNEHCEWYPQPEERLCMLGLIIFIIWRIWKWGNINGESKFGITILDNGKMIIHFLLGEQVNDPRWSGV